MTDLKDRTKAPAPAVPVATSAEISLRKWQVFRAVVQAGSVTKAAQVLGVAQPTLSEQISQLEQRLGSPLFERRAGQLHVTEFGQSLAQHAQNLLRAAEELDDMLAVAGGRRQHTVKVAGIASVLRNLVPAAIEVLGPELDHVDFELHEGDPGEVMDLLLARRIHLALMSQSTVGVAGAGFQCVPLVRDPYVFLVPEGLAAAGDLDPTAPELGRKIHVAFGARHAAKVEGFFDRVLPQARTRARVRSFDLVVEMVRAGLGVSVAPLMSVLHDGAVPKGVALYALPLAPREVVALTPNHYLHQPPYAQLIEGLRASAVRVPARLAQVAVGAVPSFVAQRWAAQGAGLSLT